MRLAGAVRPTFLNPKIGLGFASSVSKRVSGRAAFCQAAFELASFALTLSFALILALALVVVPSAAAQDDIASRRASAQDQFERAESATRPHWKPRRNASAPCAITKISFRPIAAST